LPNFEGRCRRPWQRIRLSTSDRGSHPRRYDNKSRSEANRLDAVRSHDKFTFFCSITPVNCGVNARSRDASRRRAHNRFENRLHHGQRRRLPCAVTRKRRSRRTPRPPPRRTAPRPALLYIYDASTCESFTGTRKRGIDERCRALHVWLCRLDGGFRRPVGHAASRGRESTLDADLPHHTNAPTANNCTKADSASNSAVGRPRYSILVNMFVSFLFDIEFGISPPRRGGGIL
jgi:hypothetical protein